MPSLAIVGHIALDFIRVKNLPCQRTVGGTPTYAGLSARRMGCRVKVISKVGEDFPDEYVLWLSRRGLDLSSLIRVKGARTTSFELCYKNGDRDLRILGLCEPIRPEDIPKGLRADGIHIGSIAQEILGETFRLLSNLTPCLSLDPQGYLRCFDERGLVKEALCLDQELLETVNILKASRREAFLITGFEDPLKACLALKSMGPRTVIVTGGADRTIVLGETGKAYMVPSWPSKVIDPTGAGDAFIGAFLAEYLSGEDVQWCACVGASMASFVIEGYGPSMFGSKEEVYDRAERLLEGVKKVG
ncbi:MAG: PfkB family carbohydrate kinase [Candidatus Bathyarchaeia archaeon]